MPALPRALNPATNATGLMAAAGAIYAGGVMLYGVTHHHGAWSTPVFVALVAAVTSLLARPLVTPVADPRDGAGTPLVPVSAVASLTAAPEPPDARIHVVPPSAAGTLPDISPLLPGNPE